MGVVERPRAKKVVERKAQDVPLSPVKPVGCDEGHSRASGDRDAEIAASSRGAPHAADCRTPPVDVAATRAMPAGSSSGVGVGKGGVDVLGGAEAEAQDLQTRRAERRAQRRSKLSGYFTEEYTKVPVPAPSTA